MGTQLMANPQYDDDQYVLALKYLQQDERVQRLGLCNFDTENMQKVVESGVKIYTNQVQVMQSQRSW